MKKHINSRNLAIFLAVLFVLLHYYIRTYNYQNWNNILGWDILSYYLYLPFNFIYHDPGMVNQLVIEKIFNQYHPSGTFYQAYQIPNGNWVSMYTLGFAILFAPFFFIAHLWATISGNWPADGFSYPYQFCIGNGVMIYIVAGIFVLRKVLLHFFNDRITSIVLVMLLLGTNYFIEAVDDSCMPHAMLFTAYALILWLTIRWHEKPVMKTAALLGLLLGFTILARGSEIVCLIIPICWNIYNKQTFQAKIKLLVEKKSQLLIAVLCASIVPVIQMIYWKHITGSFIFQSYQNTEGFDWNGEHIMKVLFSYKKSWFLYTPMIILPIIGIFFMRKMAKPIFPAIGIFFIANFYLIASWAAWWQGGSFGMRYFVESYAVMAIPFGFFFKKIAEQKFIVKSMAGALAGFLLFLNLFQTWQFENWMIDGYAMTKAYYWRIFLKTTVSAEDRKLLEVDRMGFKAEETFTNEGDYLKRNIGFYNFDELNTTPVDAVFNDTTVAESKPNSCRLTKDRIYSPAFRMPFDAITQKEHAWIRVSFDYFANDAIKEAQPSLVIHFDHHNRHTYKYKGWDIEKLSFRNNEWNHYSVDYLTPYPLSTDDNLQVYIYLRGQKEFNFDNLQIEAFERKW